MLRQFELFVAGVVIAIGWSVAAGVVHANSHDRLRVVFLGDRGHHRPADRAAQIAPVLASRGIDVTYTEDPNILDVAKLRKFDALLIYANIETITLDQERALLDYVETGGAFAPIHCASYCFLNSHKYVALVGAQFQRHGTGEFDTKAVDSGHPILRGLEPFRTWDETYVHHRHNEQGRRILQIREEGPAQEPWTWTRNQGKGRVFYTAYGHDGRTWQNPGFHDLLERGIRWACAKDDAQVFDSRSRVVGSLKPFAFEPAEIPFYAPSKKWGFQGEPFKRMQKPVDPAESARHLVVPKGFEPKLFAAEPDIAKPICMAWDHRGRLWIAETTDYPNLKSADNKGRDRIKICEDVDGDGKADKFTVFVDGLNIPTSLAFSRGGLIVHQAPDTLFFKDNDGDDRADVREVLFSGWGTDDTHAGPSNLRYGLDNWIYGMVGYSAFQGTVGGEKVRFRQGFYRFKPDGSKLEYLRATNNNSWGVGISEEGLIFGSTANGCASVFLPIPNRYYDSVRGWSASVLEPITASNQYFPVTDKVRQVDWHGGFTAAAGHALYTARAYPSWYWNKTAFVCEPTGHLAATLTLQPSGSGFSAYYGWNLAAGDDEWTAPIVAEVGPDGQVWMIDWYNFIVQHNPTPQGFKTGKGNAYETPLRDKTHGRIYRIVHRDAPKESTRTINLNPDDRASLLAGLKSDNQFWRLQAQRLLVERGKGDVVPALIKLVRDKTVDSIGLNPAAIHALWTLKGLGALENGNNESRRAAEAALSHPSAGVRRNALFVLPREEASSAHVVAAHSLDDPDPQVRLAALMTIADLPPDRGSARALADVLAAGKLQGDRWLLHAATSAAARNDLDYLKSIAARKPPDGAIPDVLAVTSRAAEHYARGGPADSVGSVLVASAGGGPRIAEAIVSGLSRGWPKGGPVRVLPEVDAAIRRLAKSLPPSGRGALVNLASRWGVASLEPLALEIAESFLKIARDPSQPESTRIKAAADLVEFRPRDAAVPPKLTALISPRTSPTLAAGLVESLARGESPAVGPTLIEVLPSLTPSVRPSVARALLARREWTSALVDGLERGALRPSELTLDQKQALAAYPEPGLRKRANRIIEQGGGLPDLDRQKVIERLSPLVLEGGDAVAGKKVFIDQCAKCHRHNGEGGKVGPDLSGMAAHPRAELLVHILDPSRSVEGNFVQYTVATTDGRVVNGLLSSESKNAVELTDAEGKRQVIAREDIDQIAASKKSLMPEGFEKQVEPARLADLLAFLTSRGKFLPLDIRKAATIVSTRGMFYDPNADAERLIFPDWSPKEFAGVPFLLVDPEGDRVPNVIMLNGPHGEFPPKMPKTVEIPCDTSARAIHFLSGISGWGYNGGDAHPTVSLVVRIHYTGGRIEEHALRNGVEFADYIRVVDVPESKLAFKLRNQQVRYFAIPTARDDRIDRIELIKGPDETAPVVMAVTLESR